MRSSGLGHRQPERAPARGQEVELDAGLLGDLARRVAGLGAERAAPPGRARACPPPRRGGAPRRSCRCACSSSSSLPRASRAASSSRPSSSPSASQSMRRSRNLPGSNIRWVPVHSVNPHYVALAKRPGKGEGDAQAPHSWRRPRLHRGGVCHERERRSRIADHVREDQGRDDPEQGHQEGHDRPQSTYDGHAGGDRACRPDRRDGRGRGHRSHGPSGATGATGATGAPGTSVQPARAPSPRPATGASSTATRSARRRRSCAPARRMPPSATARST